jgi:hypothetical protein
MSPRICLHLDMVRRQPSRPQPTLVGPVALRPRVTAGLPFLDRTDTSFGSLAISMFETHGFAFPSRDGFAISGADLPSAENIIVQRCLKGEYRPLRSIDARWRKP